MIIPFELPHAIVACYQPVGSRVTCNPAPTDTDEDWLILLESFNDWQPFDMWMISNGWVFGGSRIGENPGTGNEFWSYTKDHYNVICTESVEFFNKFELAINLAKRFNLMQKDERIALFQAVLYGKAV